MSKEPPVGLQGVSDVNAAAPPIPRGSGLLMPGSRANNLLRFGLLVLAGLVSVWALTWNLGAFNFGRDFNIPLQAADRWLAGGSPYVAADFLPGAALSPFLYPPYVVPIVAPLSLLPRAFVDLAWFTLLVAIACWSLRALGVRALGWPILFLWPPLSEAVFSGNVQVLLLGALVALYVARPGIPREVTDARRTGVIAALATFLPAVKIGQFHPWLHVLRRRPRAALLGAAGVALLVALTLPLMGVSAWVDWLAQIQRASDPAWMLGGFSLVRLVPVVGYVVVIAAGVAVLFVKGPRAGALVGVLLVIGAPSLYLSVTLMLLPALVMIRREVALTGALLIATSTYAGAWAGILVVAAAMALAGRVPALLEPRPAALPPAAQRA